MTDTQQRVAAKVFAKNWKIGDMKKEISRYFGWSY